MKKKVTLELCDVCEFTQKDLTSLSATRKCEVCERHLCAKSEHIADSYYSTQHMRQQFTRYVCKDCWTECLALTGYKQGTSPLPHPGIDLRASGSTSAINVAEFREWVASEVNNMANQAVVDVLREIKTGASIKFSKERAIKDLQDKHAQELAAVKQGIRAQFAHND